MGDRPNSHVYYGMRVDPTFDGCPYEFRDAMEPYVAPLQLVLLFDDEPVWLLCAKYSKADWDGVEQLDFTIQPGMDTLLELASKKMKPLESIGWYHTASLH